VKLASLKSGRDGKLVVVSTDLRRMLSAGEIAPTLQNALDDWPDVQPRLQALSDTLNNDPTFGEPFDESKCASPLPRAYQWLDGSAYLNHIELVRKARGVDMPESFKTDPIMYQGMSDKFLAPREPIAFCQEEWGIDFEAEIVAITDDVPQAITPNGAFEHIKLLMLVNDISLRNLIPAELAKGFGFLHGKPQSTFSPIAITPDELGAAWGEAGVNFPICSYVNGELFGNPNAGVDMHFSMGQLISHATKTRPLSAGTIVGAGTVSNRGADGPGKPVSEGGAGYSCIAEQRTVETILTGKPKTPFLQYGDEIAIEMKDGQGQSIFGRIAQNVLKPESGDSAS